MKDLGVAGATPSISHLVNVLSDLLAKLAPKLTGPDKTLFGALAATFAVVAAASAHGTPFVLCTRTAKLSVD